MSRNRKSQSAAIRFGPALKALLLCLLIGGSGIGYVWQKDQIVRLAQQSKIREDRLNRLRTDNEKLRNQLDALRNPKFLEGQNRTLNLGLTAPQATQIWWLVEPAADGPKPARQQQYVAGNHSASAVP